LVFLGFNLTFLTQFFLGGQGMLQRHYIYPEGFTSLQVLSSTGAYVLGVGLLIVAVNLMHSLLRGRTAPGNPWGGTTLEWQGASPPPPENYPAPPAVGEPYDFSGQEYDPATGGFMVTERPATGMVDQ
jgi:cytochrome c oxidase subunit 1